MPPRLRKLLGAFALLIWMVFYSLVAMELAMALTFPHKAIELAYYIVAGLAWILPVRPLMAWMNRP